MKVVYNGCYGGFGLSDKGLETYLKRKEITYFMVPTKESFGSSVTFFKAEPAKEIVEKIKTGDKYDRGLYTKEESKWINDNTIYEHNLNIERHDPALVSLVEELGKEANSMCADLKIEDITGNKYRINEYDGNESVSTPEDTESEWTTV